MVLTLNLYEYAMWYAGFCIVTTICILILNVRATMLVRPPFNLTGYSTFLATTSFLVFIFAPIFFVIFIFYSEKYYNGVVTALLKVYEDQDENNS